MEGWLDKALHWTTLGMEVVGILIIVVGALFATATALLKRLSRRGGPRPYEEYRANLGRAILLGLEVLVAADIIITVAIEPTLQSVAILAGIVLIRTFLSFSLEVEIQGRWPWEQRRMMESQEH